MTMMNAKEGQLTLPFHNIIAMLKSKYWQVRGNRGAQNPVNGTDATTNDKTTARATLRSTNRDSMKHKQPETCSLKVEVFH